MAPLYVAVLDASKDFDKGNHSKLFNKLIDRGCPAFIMYFQCHWHSTPPKHLPPDSVRVLFWDNLMNYMDCQFLYVVHIH